ncbi:MAG TPA: hypothetical protein VEB22_05915 [Phycisphaerales bacterium]|nr:hypothetical protein [Phycisphaerales bacterium]
MSVVVDFERVLERQREQAEREYDLALAREAVDECRRQVERREERWQLLISIHDEVATDPRCAWAALLEPAMREARRDLDDAESAHDLALATYLHLGGDPREYKD